MHGWKVGHGFRHRKARNGSAVIEYRESRKERLARLIEAKESRDRDERWARHAEENRQAAGPMQCGGMD